MVLTESGFKLDSVVLWQLRRNRMLCSPRCTLRTFTGLRVLACASKGPDLVASEAEVVPNDDLGLWKKETILP